MRALPKDKVSRTLQLCLFDQWAHNGLLPAISRPGLGTASVVLAMAHTRVDPLSLPARPRADPGVWLVSH